MLALHTLHLFPGPEVKVTELGSEDPDLAPALADLKTLDLNQEAVLLGLLGLLPSPCFPSQDGRVELKKSYLRSLFCGCTRG